ncbi:unnamed protein product [Allacma fusca]|uniref:SET domain-containing protein n=1 Tax=Allacma fusca TaxID=39272 RepID=A0A8J2KTU6_9HEXA|nr:unnamed protein product [Allacma fusca]
MMPKFKAAFTIGSELSVYREDDYFREEMGDRLRPNSDICSVNYEISEDSETEVSYCRSSCGLEAGQIIFSEKESMVYLPNLPTSTVTPVCINCGKVLEVAVRGWKDQNTCIICHWPSCENGCDFEDGIVRNSHTSMECSTLYSAGCIGFIWNGDPTMYLYLWVVRFALLKVQEPKLFESLMHRNFPLDTLPQASFNSDEIVDVATHWFPTIADIICHEELVKIGQIVLWKIKPFVGQGDLMNEVQPMILETSFAHSCHPNLRRYSQTDPYKWVVMRPVKQGDLLTFSYDVASVFSPKSERMKRLFDCYNFWCTCSRCIDDTEFGTYFSLFPCWSPACSDKVLPGNAKVDLHPSIWQPVSFIHSNRRGRERYYCSSCKNAYTPQQLRDFQIDFQSRVYRSRNSLFYLNAILKTENRLRRLHSTNYMFFEAAWNVLDLLTKTEDIKDICFLEEAHYTDYVLTAECVHFVVKRFCPELFSLENTANNNYMFRVIALIRLAVLTEDLRCGSETLVQVERRLKDIYEACNQEPRILSTVSKCQLFLKSGDKLQAGSFEFVEHHGVKMFVTAIEEYLVKKTVIFKLRRLANKEKHITSLCTLHFVQDSDSLSSRPCQFILISAKLDRIPK